MALSAARARSSPVAAPLPMSAEPASFMTGLDIVKVDVDEAQGGDQLDALDARETGPGQRRGMHRARR